MFDMGTKKERLYRPVALHSLGTGQPLSLPHGSRTEYLKPRVLVINTRDKTINNRFAPVKYVMRYKHSKSFLIEQKTPFF